MKYKLPDKVNTGLVHMIRVIANKGATIPGFISFAIGNPATEAIPAVAMKKAIIDCTGDNPYQFLSYGSSAGYQRLIDLTLDRLQNKRGFIKEDRDLLMLAGSGQGLGLVPRTICSEGDEVYIEEISYTNAYNGMVQSGCKAVPIAMDEKGMIPEALEKAAKKGKGKYIYLNPTFQNPTGLTIPLERRKAIYEVARKYNLMIYEDDPYGEIRFRGEAVPTFASFDTDGRVIYAGSYSKTLSAGMRVGYLYGNTEIIAALRKIKGSSEGQQCILPQMIVAKTIDDVDYDKHIQNICDLYKEKSDTMVQALKKYCTSKMKINEPEGGMFLWITFPEGTDVKGIMEKTLERGVGIVPGSAFATDVNKPGTSFRLNYTYTTEEKVEKGIRIFGEVTKQFCGE